MGCKFTSSLVYLWGGGRNFGPHVRTQLKFEYPPGGAAYGGRKNWEGKKEIKLPNDQFLIL